MRFKIADADFGVVKDTERHFIVDSGLYEHMVGLAETYNEQYQSRAYKAERWDSNR